MKTFNFFNQTGRKGLLTAAALIAVSLTSLNAQTIDIGPNQYAFRFTQNPNYGLFFNSTDVAYDFRNGSGNAVWSINANNGQLRNDLQFASGFTLRVPAGTWAARSATAPNAGIFFGNADFEFRIANGTPGWSMSAATGNSTFLGTVSAQGGNSNQWNQAHAWGNHATAGYITAESDPKIDLVMPSSVPRWSGSKLEESSLSATSSSATVSGAPSTILGGNLLTLNNTYSGGTLQNSEPRLSFQKNGTVVGSIMGTSSKFLVSSTEDAGLALRTGSIERLTITPDGSVGINTTDPQNRLHVEGTIFASTNNYAIRGVKTGTGTFPGVWGESESTSSNASGVRGFVNATTAGAGSAGIYGHNYSTNNNGHGVKGIHNGGGNGVNGETVSGRGVSGFASAGSATGTAYGVYGQAIGTAGTRIGVYGTASGGATNWAGYFAGNQYVSGDLRIGTIGGAAGYKLSVNGKAICTEMRVQLVANWPDYVFDEGYEKLSLDELEKFVATEKHLPNIPSASEVEAQGGVDLGEMQRLTIEKVEELTLYLLELKKTSDELRAENELLRNRIDALEK